MGILKREILDDGVRRSATSMVWVGILIMWLISMALVVSTIDKSMLKIGVCLGIFIIFSAWGHVVLYPIHYKKGRILEGFVWSTISGVAIASLITSGLVYIIGWNLLIIFVSVTLLPGLMLYVLITRVEQNNKSQTYQNPDPKILLMTLVVVTLFFYFPFKNLGVLVGDKYLYVWLFGHDFINRMVHVNSLSAGLPLDSFFFAGEKLSYYWLAYVFPALLRNLDWMKLETKEILQITQLLYALLATAGLVVFINGLVRQKRLVGMLTFMTFCCYSYVWFLTVPLEFLRRQYGDLSVNVFGYNLVGFSGFSHAFYRFFLVEPQATLGIGLVLMILSLYKRKESMYVFGIIGLLLGLLFGVEATNGIMLILWFTGMSLVMLFSDSKERYSMGKKHGFSLICGALICSILFAIEMYSFHTGSGVLRLSLNWFPVITGPLYFIFAYGPMFLFGIAGLFKIVRERERVDHWGYHYILLFGISIFFVFFIASPTELHFGLLKATRIIPVCLLVFSAYYFEKISGSQKLSRIVMTLMLMGLPSLFTDNFIASDISNPSTYLRSSDMEAAKWIKRNLPRAAVLQAEPNYPGGEKGYNPKYAYSFIPIFSERPTGIGEWKVSSQEHSKGNEVRHRFHSVIEMFSTTNLDEGIDIIKRYNIAYIYIGELERTLYPNGVAKFLNSEHFQLIYSKGKVSIYKHVW